MSFINPLEAFPQPDIKNLLLSHYQGKSWDELPTPSFYVKKSVVQGNCTRMLKRVEAMGARFRGHVKTHKTNEITRMMMGYDLPEYEGKKHSSIVVSTLKEAWAVLDFQEKTGEHVVDDIIFGLPNFSKESLTQVKELRKKVKSFTILCDCLEQIQYLQEFDAADPQEKPWSVMVKLESGSHRAGISEDGYLVKVLEEILNAKNVSLYGFYAHSGHSYASKTIEESEISLIGELETVKHGLEVLEKAMPAMDLSKLIVSVGATPTTHSLEHHLFQQANETIAHIVSEMKCTLEFHAGNYPMCDLQQVSTGCVTEDRISGAVIGTVVSKYAGRNNEVGELLTNTGVICMSREVSHKFAGFGQIRTKADYGSWKLDRMSQEHGILAPNAGEKAELIPLGTKVKVLPNHCCITANSFNAYYILDEEEKVVDVWIPWRGW